MNGDQAEMWDFFMTMIDSVERASKTGVSGDYILAP